MKINKKYWNVALLYIVIYAPIIITVRIFPFHNLYARKYLSIIAIHQGPGHGWRIFLQQTFIRIRHESTDVYVCMNLWQGRKYLLAMGNTCTGCIFQLRFFNKDLYQYLFQSFATIQIRLNNFYD